MPSPGEIINNTGGWTPGTRPDPNRNWVTDGTNPLDGFSSRYVPAQLDDIIWDSPWAILPDVFRGINTDSTGYQALRDLGADPLTLFNMMAGSSRDLASEGSGGYANWLADLYTSMGTRGGRGFDSKELLNNIFSPDKDSALARILNSGDASTQMRTLFNFVREATNAGMNPLAARGYQAAFAREGDKNLNNILKTNIGEGESNNEFFKTFRNSGLIPR